MHQQCIIPLVQQPTLNRLFYVFVFLANKMMMTMMMMTIGDWQLGVDNIIVDVGYC